MVSNPRHLGIPQVSIHVPGAWADLLDYEYHLNVTTSRERAIGPVRRSAGIRGGAIPARWTRPTLGVPRNPPWRRSSSCRARLPTARFHESNGEWAGSAAPATTYPSCGAAAPAPTSSDGSRRPWSGPPPLVRLQRVRATPHAPAPRAW